MKKAFVILVLVAAVDGLTSVNSLSACTSDCVHLLFVGNSLTHGASNPVLHYNNANVHDFNGTSMGGVPAILQKLATDGGRSNLAISIEAVSGVTLAYHLGFESSVITDPGSYGPWDWVILQDYSTRPTTNTIVGGSVAGFRDNVQTLNGLAMSNNPAVKTLLFCTWARPDLVAVGAYPSIQSMQSQLTTNYSDAARDFNLFGFAPVGDAFMATVASGLSINPTNGLQTPGPGQINLWQSDIYHASVHGSYLAALVFYAKILGADPRSLPTGAGSAASDLDLNPTVASQLQSIAYETVFVDNFSFTVEPNAQTVTVGSNATFTVTVGATNEFAGDVMLSMTDLPSEISADFSPSFVTASGTSTLTVTTYTNTPPGSYALTVTGTSSNITHSAVVTVTVTVPDYSFTVDTNEQTVTVGSNVTFAVTVSATNEFTGDVTLSVTGLPTEVSADFSPSFVTGSGTSALTVTTFTNTPPGSYPLTIIGTSSNITHSVGVTLTINRPDYSFTVGPNAETVITGGNAIYTVTVGATNGFNEDVALCVTGLPMEVSADFSPSFVTGSGTSTLTVTTLTNTPPGSYPLTITGISSNIIRTASVTLTIDTPGHTIPDWWKQAYFSCTNCPQADLTADPDGDGMGNLAEFLAGTDPTNSASALRIIGFTQKAKDMRIVWTTAGGRTNAVQAAEGGEEDEEEGGEEGGVSTNFVDISGLVIIDGSGDVTTNYVDVGGATNGPAHFYRVRVVP